MYYGINYFLIIFCASKAYFLDVENVHHVDIGHIVEVLKNYFGELMDIAARNSSGWKCINEFSYADFLKMQWNTFKYAQHLEWSTWWVL